MRGVYEEFRENKDTSLNCVDVMIKILKTTTFAFLLKAKPWMGNPVT